MLGTRLSEAERRHSLFEADGAVVGTINFVEDAAHKVFHAFRALAKTLEVVSLHEFENLWVAAADIGYVNYGRNNCALATKGFPRNPLLLLSKLYQVCTKVATAYEGPPS